MQALEVEISRKTSLEDPEMFWNPSSVADSEKKYFKILESLDLKVIADGVCCTELLCWIALAEGHQGRLSDSGATLEKSNTLLEKLGDSTSSSTKVRWLLERSRLYILEKTPSQADYLLKDAWVLAQAEHKDHLLVEILHLHSTYELPKFRSQWIQKAINVGEQAICEKARKWLGILYVD